LENVVGPFIAREVRMKRFKIFNVYLALFTPMVAGILAGCAAAPTKSIDVSESLRHSLDQAGLNKVSVAQDRDKGVVTLGGNVTAEADKSRAESIAASIAGGQVVADEIAVVPAGNEQDAKAMNSDLDKGIEQNLDAALIQNKLKQYVKFSVKNEVVTLTGDVDSETLRRQSAQIASAVPNVRQVVNELQVRKQKATSSD
jgi:hyperosmotically inducible protein